MIDISEQYDWMSGTDVEMMVEDMEDLGQFDCRRCGEMMSADCIGTDRKVCKECECDHESTTSEVTKEEESWGHTRTLTVECDDCGSRIKTTTESYEEANGTSHGNIYATEEGADLD